MHFFSEAITWYTWYSVFIMLWLPSSICIVICKKGKIWLTKYFPQKIDSAQHHSLSYNVNGFIRVQPTYFKIGLWIISDHMASIIRGNRYANSFQTNIAFSKFKAEAHGSGFLVDIWNNWRTISVAVAWLTSLFF